MLKFATCFSFAFLSLGLYGSVAEGQGEGRYVCLLHDPPNQCGEFCLEALKPMLDHIAFHQKEWIACGTQNETQTKLDKIEDYLLKFQESLEKKEATWKNVIDRLEKQLTDLQETQSKAKKSALSFLFQRIGERLFYIETAIRRTWNESEESCRSMGGHLATIQNNVELTAIVEKLERSTSYWLGVTDVVKEGEFVSVASGKPTSFFKWRSGQPNNLHGNDHCVDIYNGDMYDSECKEPEFYICEALG